MIDQVARKDGHARDSKTGLNRRAVCLLVPQDQPRIAPRRHELADAMGAEPDRLAIPGFGGRQVTQQQCRFSKRGKQPVVLIQGAAGLLASQRQAHVPHLAGKRRRLFGVVE
jgi:hypothetical protein